MRDASDSHREWFTTALQLSVARHSLTWLALANLVGLHLALLLFHPEWGERLGEFSYGRWVPLHLNWQLYGWCSLPAVGVLLRHYLPPTKQALHEARWLLRLWSGALLVGAWSWLHGHTTGKLFLDWTGLPRLVFILAQFTLWCILARNYWGKGSVRAGRSREAVIVDSTLLALLATVPVALSWSCARTVYPPIDPGTGGPTGASLLGSTLVIVLIVGLLPIALSRPARNRRIIPVFQACLGGSLLLFLALRHAPAPHGDWRQIVCMGSLLVWLPLAPASLAAFEWTAGSQRWRVVASAWWALLIVTGIASFLPGILDHLKFTHALVAHAHLAMAGFLGALNFLILCNLHESGGFTGRILGQRWPWLIWNGAVLLHLAALSGLAFAEVRSGGRFVLSDLTLWPLARLTAGLLMTAISIYWLWHMRHPVARRGATPKGSRSFQAPERPPQYAPSRSDDCGARGASSAHARIRQQTHA
jgi:cytochrome c oxidase cbb3-type subunit 1